MDRSRAKRLGAASAAALVLVLAGSALGQNPTESATTAEVPPATQASAPPPTTVPISDIVASSEEVERTLAATNKSLALEPATAVLVDKLPGTVAEVDRQIAETAELLAANPSLDSLRELESTWTDLGKRFDVWSSDLAKRSEAIEAQLTRLRELQQTWERTLESIRSEAVPAEIVARAGVTVLRIRDAVERVERARADTLTYQERVSNQQKRVEDALAMVREVRDHAVTRLFAKDSPSLWSSTVLERSAAGMMASARDTLALQANAVGAYAREHVDNFILHAVVFLLLLGALAWARRRVRPWVQKEPSLAPAATVFEHAISAALILSILASSRLYPQGPRLLMVALGAAALVPTVVILRKLVDRSVLPALSALVLFYFVGIVERIFEPIPLVSRIVLLVEALAAALVLGWGLARRLNARTDDDEPVLRRAKLVRAVAFVGLLLAIASTIANALGYVALARLLVNGELGSAYTAVLLFATIRILDGLMMFLLRVRPLVKLRMVASYRRLIRRRIVLVLEIVAALVWALVTLELFSIRVVVLAAIERIWSASLSVGAIHISLGDAVLFVLTVWAAVLLSRFVRFVLEEDVYTRTDLGRGIPYAVSTVAHYAVLAIGFIFALSAVGVDMTRLTVLAGAFSVGLGFGLQNIFNNFVSGIILLAERPVKVGDVVEIKGQTGKLRRIGLRASVVRTQEGSELIVPNGMLISDQVINWTLSDQQRRIDINVGVAYGTDPIGVLALLVDAARSHPDVLDDPAPQATFIAFGDNSLDFRLFAWTDKFDRWQVIKSDLTVAINTALRDAGIDIPFPQRELRIVNETRGSIDSATSSGTDMAVKSSETR